MTVLRLARLASRAVIAVSGPDWRSFLQGLLTQDVETLAVGELRFAGLLTPQGKLLYDLFVAGTEDGALLDVAAAKTSLRLLVPSPRRSVDAAALSSTSTLILSKNVLCFDGLSLGSTSSCVASGLPYLRGAWRTRQDAASVGAAVLCGALRCVRCVRCMQRF